MSQQILKLSGMSCGHCVARVKKALEAVPGVVVRDVKVGEATVELDDGRVKVEDVREAVENAGYDVVSR